MSKEKNSEEVVLSPVVEEKIVEEVVVEVAPTPVVEEKKQPIKANKIKVVNCFALNVRKAPDIKSDILVVANRDTLLTVIKISGTWAHVITPKGVTGFVKLDFTKEV